MYKRQVVRDLILEDLGLKVFALGKGLDLIVEFVDAALARAADGLVGRGDDRLDGAQMCIRDRCKWLFRCMGEYFTRECSARAAFDAYESYRKDDPHALLARYAAEEE